MLYNINNTTDNINKEIAQYNNGLLSSEKAICELLAECIEKGMKKSESKAWHGHPVWFLDGNPIVGYSALKNGIRLMFWSGQTFTTKGLESTGKFKAAKIDYKTFEDIDVKTLAKWLKEAHVIQWDYKNIVKRKGALTRLV